MSQLRYKAEIYAPGVTATTGTISWTFKTSQFAEAPQVGGQIVRPLDGRVESNPWELRLTDVGSTVTSILSSSGRLQLLGRMVRVRQSVNSTASSSYTNLGVGRLTDVVLGDDVASWRLLVSDERWQERQMTVFTRVGYGVSLIPMTRVTPFQTFPMFNGKHPWICKKKSGNLVALSYRTDAGYPLPTSNQLASLIQDDVKPTIIPGNYSISAGNFNTLRYHNTVTNTDYEIQGFAQGGVFVGIVSGDHILGPIGDPSWGQQNGPQGLVVWIVWPTSQPNVGDTVYGFVAAPTHAPTNALPLLLGGAGNLVFANPTNIGSKPSLQGGYHPADLVKDLYNGVYSTAGSVRASTAALAKWRARGEDGHVWFRITRPWNLADFVEQRCYAPYGVVPVVDSSGKIAPVSVLNPASSVFAPANLPTLSSTNLAAPHPTWMSQSRELLSQVVFTQEVYGLQPDINQAPLDGLTATTISRTTNWDSITRLGLVSRTYAFGSLMPGIKGFSPPTTALAGIFTPTAAMQARAQSLFARFGDGPVYSDVVTLPSADQTTNGTLLPGQYAKIVLGTYPNLGANARGSTRVLQVMSRTAQPNGAALSLLDLGAPSNPLGTPSLALALSSMSSRHAVKYTITSMPVGARFRLAFNATSTGTTAAPGSTMFRAAGPAGTTSALVGVFGALPSGRKIWGRVRAEAPNRINSAWSAAASVVTAKIAGPTGLGISGVATYEANVSWTNGSSLYGIQVCLGNSTSDVLGTSQQAGLLRPQTTKFQLTGLDKGTKHKVGVRHWDIYGGFSTMPTGTFTTTTGLVVPPHPPPPFIIHGAQV